MPHNPLEISKVSNDSNRYILNSIIWNIHLFEIKKKHTQSFESNNISYSIILITILQMEKTCFHNSESRSQCQDMNMCNIILLWKKCFEITNKKYLPCTLPWAPSFSFKEINKVFFWSPSNWGPKLSLFWNLFNNQ